MPHDPTPIDEYALAAFLAGRLSEDRRAEVIAYLASNADARELLCLAQDAMEAALAPVSEASPLEPIPHTPQRTADLPTATPTRDARPAVRKVTLVRVAMAACLVVLIGLGLFAANPSLRNAFRGAPDSFRGTAEETSLRVDVTTGPELVFEWNKIADAYYYRLVIIDTETVDIVAQHVTRDVRLGNDDAFVRSLDTRLTPGRTYSLTVDAIDVQYRTLRSSSATRFAIPDRF